MRPRTRFAVALVAVMLSAAGVASAQDLPNYKGYVNDFAQLIDDGQERLITQMIEAVRDQTGAEIAVVTVASIRPYATIEQFGIALAEKWQVGPADTDEGVILIVAESERQVRIEVGYGLEGALPDGKTGSILDTYVVPYLRNNDYGTGLQSGVAAIAQIIGDEKGVTVRFTDAQRVPPAQQPTASFDFSRLFYLFFILLFVGGRWFLFPLLFMGRRRGFFGGGFGTTGRSSGGFSSRSGGSFGGFGGGGFGGGGASRGF